MDIDNDEDALKLPVEMIEYIISVCCLSQLLDLCNVHSMLEYLVTLEVKKRLKNITRSIIKKGFSTKEFPICFYLGKFNSNDCGARSESNEINIYGMNFVLTFLKLFGSHIEYVVCDFCGANEEQANLVFSHVNKYCTKLNRIAFGNLNHSLRNSFERPFENVTYVFIQYCRLYDRLCELNTYFPKVEEIIFSEKNKFENVDNVLVHYAHLKKAEICSGSLDIINSVFLQLLHPNATIFYTKEVYNLLDL